MVAVARSRGSSTTIELRVAHSDPGGVVVGHNEHPADKRNLDVIDPNAVVAAL
jgi:hypothetical protein